PYSGIVRSKTGTLEVANSNVGLTVTDDGRTLWFGVNTTGAGQDYAGARDEQDGLIEALTDCNCSGKYLTPTLVKTIEREGMDTCKFLIRTSLLLPDAS